MISRIFIRLGGLAMLCLAAVFFLDGAAIYGAVSIVIAALLFWAASQLYRAEREHLLDLTSVAASRDQEDEQ